MKLSKIDPMTALMVVVAIGVLVTMLTQNSVASVNRVSVNASQIEKQASAEHLATVAQMSEGNLKKTVRHVSYDFSADLTNGSTTKLSTAAFY